MATVPQKTDIWSEQLWLVKFLGVPIKKEKRFHL